ncbi:hypothetical protein [Wenzhouxiangella sp. 15190]|nr:hypothetical protein [Wenzhouxiangella sp. 15190]
MKSPTPFQLLIGIVGLSMLLAGSPINAQPGGPPGGPPGDPPGGGGPPPWAGDDGDDDDDEGGDDDPDKGPPWGGGPPPWAGDDGDDDDDEEGNDDEGGVPDFCRGGPQPGGPDGQAGMSSIAHLDFSQQDPDTGEAVEDGANARIMYRWMAPLFDFVFNAHGLEPGDEHTLTYQPQPLPSTGVICLSTGIVNEEGDLHLEDAFELDTDLPAEYDENEDEAILALVDTVDVDCEAGEMTAWLPENYLFGDEGMFYVDSDLEDEEDDEEGDEEDGEG